MDNYNFFDNEQGKNRNDMSNKLCECYNFYAHLPRIGRKKLTAILNEYDSLYDIYCLPEMYGYDKAKEMLLPLKEIGALTDRDIELLLSWQIRNEARKDLYKYYSQGIKITTIESDDYPRNLLSIYDPPYILYYKGSLPTFDSKTVAIVGARDCSEYGRSMARQIAGNLSLNGINVVSGFARGIDTAAHNGCLNGDASGRTYAIFGCGVNICYPSENRFMYDEIIENGGGIISEFLPDAPAIKGQFPLRNRIISGLSDLLIVVEAGIKSGSLISADLALEQNRVVMALPGRVCDRLSEGCNRLIRQGAAIISCMEDIYYELGISVDIMNKYTKVNTNSQIKLAKSEKMLYSQLDFSPQSIQSLGEQCKLSTSELLRSLSILELNGLVKEVGGCYMRV